MGHVDLSTCRSVEENGERLGKANGGDDLKIDAMTWVTNYG